MLHIIDILHNVGIDLPQIRSNIWQDPLCHKWFRKAEKAQKEEHEPGIGRQFFQTVSAAPGGIPDKVFS